MESSLKTKSQLGNFTVVEGFSTDVFESSYNLFNDLQDKVLSITDTERSRIQKIKDTYLDEDQNRDRILLMRQTEQAKRSKYILLCSIFVFICLVAFIFTYIQRVLNQNSVAFDIILVILLGLFLVLAFYVYIDIRNRDLNDFSKLRPDASNLLPVQDPNASRSTIEDSSTTNITSNCKGAECCDTENVIWNKEANACVRA